MNGSSGTDRLWPWPGQVPGEHVEVVGRAAAAQAAHSVVAEVPSDGPRTSSGSSARCGRRSSDAVSSVIGRSGSTRRHCVDVPAAASPRYVGAGLVPASSAIGAARRARRRRRRPGSPPSGRRRTRSPASRSAVCETATRVRRTRSRSVAHSACQPPSARSSTCWAAARCRVAASCGVVRAARRTSTDSTGLALCGIVDEPPPRALGELADLGPRQVEHVVGDPAAGVGAADERVADPGDRRPGRVPARARRPAASPTELDDRRRGCRRRRRAAPGSASRATSSYASSTPVSHARDPEARTSSARRAGSGSARPSGCRGGRSARPASRRRPRRGRGAASATAAARHPHQRGVDDVLAGEPAVQPARVVAVQPLAEQPHQRDDRVAAGLGVAARAARRRSGTLEVAAEPAPPRPRAIALDGSRLRR